jgi:hypothetical protein
MIASVDQRHMYRPWEIEGIAKLRKTSVTRCKRCKYWVEERCVATDAMAQCPLATPANLAHTLAGLVDERSQKTDITQRLFVAAIERMLLDAVGVTYDLSSRNVRKNAVADARYVLKSELAAELAELAGVDPGWFKCRARRFLMAVDCMRQHGVVETRGRGRGRGGGRG